MIHTRFQTNIQILRSDGGEYIDKDIKHFFKENGILYQKFCRDTPQQNGVAERKNRTLLEITWAMTFESNVLTYFWSQVIATANYLSNRLPHKKLKHKTPLDFLKTYVYVLSTHSLLPRVFGSTIYVTYPNVAAINLKHMLLNLSSLAIERPKRILVLRSYHQKSHHHRGLWPFWI